MVIEMLTCAVPAGNFLSRDAFGLMFSQMASLFLRLIFLFLLESLAIAALVELAFMCLSGKQLSLALKIIDSISSSSLVVSDADLLFSAMQLHQDFQILRSHQWVAFITHEAISSCWSNFLCHFSLRAYDSLGL